MTRASLWLTAAACLAACGGDPAEVTEIVLVVDTDVSLAAGDALELAVTGATGSPYTITAPLWGAKATELPSTLGIVHGGGPLAPVDIRARLMRAGEELVSRRVRTGFLPRRTLKLQLNLLTACAGVACGAEQSCGEDGCAMVDVDPESLPAWDGPPAALGTRTGDADASAGVADAGDDLADSAAGPDVPTAPTDDASVGGDASAPAPGCTDRDADGYCAGEDCDDRIATCHEDCTTNSDASSEPVPVVDCVERLCGSDPQDGVSHCALPETAEALGAAVEAANAAAGHDYILLTTDLALADALPPFTGGDGITLRALPAVALTLGGSASEVLHLAGDNSRIEGVAVRGTGAVDTLVLVTGDDNAVVEASLSAFAAHGVFVSGGDRTRIERSWVYGATRGPADQRGAIVLDRAADTVLVGNVVVNNLSAGIKLRQTTGTFLDHNTVAHNGGAGIEFYGRRSSGVCMRNNLVAGNAEAGLQWSIAGNAWSADPACTEPLVSGASWGNAGFGNGALCGGACDGCSCTPPDVFWSWSDDPNFASLDQSSQLSFCIGAETLIDAAEDLGYDRNGEATGEFNGAAPEPGAREAASGGCP